MINVYLYRANIFLPKTCIDILDLRAKIKQNLAMEFAIDCLRSNLG